MTSSWPWSSQEDSCQGSACRRGVPLCLGALVRQVEEGDHRGEGVLDAQLLEHPVVRDTLPEGADDVGVLEVWDRVAHLTEALDVVAQRLVRLQMHGSQVVGGEGTLIRTLEVGEEDLAELLPGADGALGEVEES